ncbi:MAG: DUF692 domain-containing protein [Myxococcaceae bacterium]|nr:DUF692 domain-containing protein [Myxococcaceae bacterium]
MFPRLDLGHGVGLRSRHYGEFLESQPKVDWLEAISENFMGTGGRPLAVLDKVRVDRPVVLHGVSLGIGSVDPLDEQYLKEWKQLIDRIEPAMVSDHLCWGRYQGRYSHDLLPMPFTEEAIGHVVSRVQAVQDRLKRQLVLENVSSYLTYPASTMSEAEFTAEVARRADCGLLVDINNIYVSAKNHGFDPKAYIDAMPLEHVAQFHLAGHFNRGDLIIDTHEGHIIDEVWQLYAYAVERLGRVPTLIEWDTGVPDLETLLAEAEKARVLEYETFERANAEAEKVMLG